jgi:hypothetical protein
MQIAKVVKNVLSGVAAVMCSANAIGNNNYVATRVSCRRLEQLYRYKGSLINEAYPNFKDIKARGELKELANADKFLRVLNASIGLTIRINAQDKEQTDYKFKLTSNIFKHFKAV